MAEIRLLEHTGIYVNRSCQNLHVGSLTCEVGDIIALKVKKVTSVKIKSELKQYGIPCGGAEIIATIENLKDSVLVVPTPSPFNSPILRVQKTEGSLRMTDNYQKLSQVVIPIGTDIGNEMWYP